MKQKICVWINNNFVQLGVAKYLQDKENFELYAIVDSTTGIEEIIKNQEIVKFEKIWYFGNNLNPDDAIDLKYLEKIEKETGIIFSFVASVERLFYKEFNQYYHFQHSEILSILEKETKFFQSILLNVKFDFILCSPIARHFQYLFYLLAKDSKIPFLAFEPIRFGDRYIISNGLFLESAKKVKLDGTIERSEEEIKDFLQTYKPRKFYKNTNVDEKYKIKKDEKVKALLSFPFAKNVDEQNFGMMGRTKKNILLKGLGSTQKKLKKKREDYMNENFVKKVSKNENYIYYPLHVEPEKVLHIGAPLYTDQIAVIRNIAKYLPVNYKLYVKEHPGMEKLGWREISYFKKLEEIPNVRLIHPTINTKEIIENCSLVISIRGTSSLEATFYEKPSIVLVEDWGYSLIPSIRILNNLDELPKSIIESLKMKVKITDLGKFIDFIEKNSFELDFIHYQHEIAHRFNYNVGYMKKPEFKLNDLKKLFNEFDELIDTLGNEFIKKMQKLEIDEENCQV